MTILNALKFVQGSIAKKDFVPALKHFLIENGRVNGFNGTLALSSPIPFGLSCKPQADMLIKAIANCEDVIQLGMTPAGKLSIKSGVFKSNILCVEGDTPHVQPEGEVVNFNGEAFLKGIKAVAPFIGEDASRLWAQGVLLKDKSFFATNNVMLVQYWLGANFPSVVNIPRAAIKEMIRINEPPLFAQLALNSITFHYEGERWLRTQLYSTEWPDLSRILDKESVQAALDETLFNGLEIIKPFVDKHGIVYIRSGEITTDDTDTPAATYNIPSMLHEGKFAIEMLNLLKNSAKTIDWTSYPAPCLFTGDCLRGAIVGWKP
jgi:DNA polymerase III sliding clamp (beta) subunit (PCNA family)